MTSAALENCQFCETAEFRYTCPKCNALYCSVTCYRSAAHLKCSEEFYKSCIRDELITKEPNSRKDMHKIYDILKRIRESDEGINPEDFDAHGLDEPLDSDDERPEVIDEDDENDEEIDEDDLALRLQGIDINNSEAVWERLTSEEQLEFQQLIDSGDIMKLLPDYTPWWIRKQNSKIVVLPIKEEEKEVKNLTPKISSNIQIFSDLCKKTPSPCLHYNIWNIITAYACIVRFFSGEHLKNSIEAAANLVNLSATLKYGTNFEDADDAIISVEMEALTTGNGVAGAAKTNASLLMESREQLQQDARQLMSSRQYKLAAFSDILQLLTMAKTQAKRSNVEQADFQKLFALCSGSIVLNRNKLQPLIKKMEFLLSYINRDNSSDLI